MTAPPGTLILVRHGQSLWNHEDRFAGWADIPLTPEGEAEARRAGEWLKKDPEGYRFDRAYTSMLARAQETLRIILETIGQPNVPVERSAALNERHYGDLQGQKRADVSARVGAEQVRIWRRSYRTRPPGGESLEDTAARVLPYYHDRIEPHVRSGETVLVVAHGSTVRTLVMALDQLSEEAIESLEIPTGIPLRYRISPSGVVLDRANLGSTNVLP